MVLSRTLETASKTQFLTIYVFGVFGRFVALLFDKRADRIVARTSLRGKGFRRTISCRWPFAPYRVFNQNNYIQHESDMRPCTTSSLTGHGHCHSQGTATSPDNPDPESRKENFEPIFQSFANLQWFVNASIMILNLPFVADP